MELDTHHAKLWTLINPTGVQYVVLFYKNGVIVEEGILKPSITVQTVDGLDVVSNQDLMRMESCSMFRHDSSVVLKNDVVYIVIVSWVSDGQTRKYIVPLSRDSGEVKSFNQTSFVSEGKTFQRTFSEPYFYPGLAEKESYVEHKNASL